MKTVLLGKRGPRVSIIGLGFWQAGGRLWKDPGGEWVFKVLEKGLEHGITLIDTAEVYGFGRSERLIGEALKRLGMLDEPVIASKIAGYRIFEHEILKAIDNINKRIGRSIDIIQAHWPPPVYVNVCRVVKALEKAVTVGKVAYYGLSNYPGNLLVKALECSKRIEPVSNQIQYNLLYRTPENDVIPVAEEAGIGILAWSPLAKGVLAGVKEAKDPAQKSDPVFRAGLNDKGLQKALEELSLKYRVSKAVIALAWLISKAAVPIPGTRKPERINDYVQAAALSLSYDDLRLLDNVSSQYIVRWGKRYKALQYLRYIPSVFQRIAVGLGRGV